MRGFILAGLILTLSVSGHAQDPVERVPDVVSYGTAIVNPAIGIYKAARGPRPLCHIGQFLISEGLGNGGALGLKYFVVSPRPCAGCDRRGMPSAHAMNSVIGVSSNWKFGVYFSVATAQLRTEAKRHTPWQVAAGLGLGALAEWGGQKVLSCR